MLSLVRAGSKAINAKRFQFHLASSLCVQRTGVSLSFKKGMCEFL